MMIQERLYSLKEAKIEQEHQAKIEQYERKIKVLFTMISSIISLHVRLHFLFMEAKQTKKNRNICQALAARTTQKFPLFF
jgi:hypothetical protein